MTSRRQWTAIDKAIFAVVGSAWLLLGIAAGSMTAQSEAPTEIFNDGEASKLLRQVAEGLQGHSARKMLSAFDISRMESGALFKEQVTAFFTQYETIRVHFKLVEVREQVVIVEAEMDETPPDATSPPVRKSMELRFTGAKSAKGWRFIDVQPRDFFS